MKYYCEYNPATDTRRVVAYDEERHGIRYAVGRVWLYNGAVCVSCVYDTPEGAMQAWGENSRKPVTMPDGYTASPVDFFHPDRDARDVFVSWADIRGEVIA